MDKWQEYIKSEDSDKRQMAIWELKEFPIEKSLEHLIYLLGDPDWRVRKAVSEVLIEKSTKEVIRALISALYDEENAGKRNTAIETLHKIGLKILPFVLEELKKTENYDVKLALTSLLGDIRSDEAFHFLLSYLQKEKEINVLSNIISSLSHYKRKETIPSLLKLLNHENPWIQFHCIEALGNLKEPEVLPHILPLYKKPGLQKCVLDSVTQINHISTLPFLLDIIKSEEKINLSAIHAIVSLYNAKLPKILKKRYQEIVVRKVKEEFPRDKVDQLITIYYQTPKVDIKKDIIYIIGWISDEKGVGLLFEALKDPDFSDLALEALSWYGRGGWQMAKEYLKKDQVEDFLVQILRLLKEWKEPESIPYILNLMESPEFSVKYQAIDTISIFPKKELVLYLLTLLEDESPAIQNSAVQVLKEWGEKDENLKDFIFEKVTRLIQSNKPALRINSLEIFVHLKGKGYFEILQKASVDPDPLIRKKAIQLMGQCKDERFSPFVIHALTDEDPKVRLEAIQALNILKPEEAFESLLSALEDPDFWIRASAAKVLGGYPKPQALKSLVHHLHNDIPPVKINCLESLGKLQDPKSLEIIIEQLRYPDVEVKKSALQSLGFLKEKKAYEILISYTQNPDWRLRASAVSALGIMKKKDCLPVIHEIIEKDPDTFVKISALSTLKEIADESSFQYLMKALDNPDLIDKVAEVFIGKKEIFLPLIEKEWQKTDKKREEILAVILEEMKENGS